MLTAISLLLAGLQARVIHAADSSNDDDEPSLLKKVNEEELNEVAKGLNERAWEEEDDPDLMDYYNEAELEWNQLPDDRKKYW